LGFHSYDAGVSPTAVFWVARIPEGSAHVDLHQGTASLEAHKICVFDTFTVPNSVNLNRPLGNLVKAVINSLRLRWTGIGRRVTFSDSANKFRGNFVENSSATIEVTVTTPRGEPMPERSGHGFRFVSDPASTSISHFAQIGHESNGRFF